MTVLICPGCSSRVRVPDGMPARRLTCPKCSSEVAYEDRSRHAEPPPGQPDHVEIVPGGRPGAAVDWAAEQARWWAEDAERVNQIGEAARQMGITRSAGPPGLTRSFNPDGSEVDEPAGNEGGD